MSPTFALVSVCMFSLLLCIAAQIQELPTSWQPIGPSTNPAPVLGSSVSRVATLATNMYNRWATLDAACDPRAVFAVAYLYMTHNARVLIQNGYFDDGNKMADFIINFAQRYTNAYDQWELGHESNVSLPWAVYFTSCENNRSDVTQDITVGMNAHINYDLAISAYECGYAVPQWETDYYRVNDLMHQVDVNITHALGRYDPLFYNEDYISEVYFQASIDFVTSWRTDAYMQAQAYQYAITPLTRRALMLASESAIAVAGQAVAVPYLFPTDTTRVPYCQANHYPLVL